MNPFSLDHILHRFCSSVILLSFFSPPAAQPLRHSQLRMLSHASAHPGAMQGSTRSRSPFPRVVKELTVYSAALPHGSAASGPG